MMTRSQTLRILIAMASMSVLSCRQATNPESPSSQAGISGVGHVQYWSDGGPTITESAASGVWLKNAAGDSATLHATVANGRFDTVRLVHRTSAWSYDSHDARACYPMAPVVRETSDSLIVAMSSGFTIDTYFLRKQ